MNKHSGSGLNQGRELRDDELDAVNGGLVDLDNRHLRRPIASRG